MLCFILWFLQRDNLAFFQNEDMNWTDWTGPMDEQDSITASQKHRKHSSVMIRVSDS